MNAYLCREALGLPIYRDKFHPRLSAGVTIIFGYIVMKFPTFRDNPKIANAIKNIMSCHHVAVVIRQATQ